jgi:hypothetical protein
VHSLAALLPYMQVEVYALPHKDRHASCFTVTVTITAP